MANAIARARKTAKMVLEDQYDPLLACRELADLREELSAVLPRDVLNLFAAVSSEVDDLPIGPERAYWAEDVLRAKDLQAANYREQVRGEVEKALWALLDATG